ncbi:hypothetical protein [Arthrobacter sp. ZGTC131]|uniref:hypothetical protein n=1 Tax=Arthrobacter sp. ZGTC131 TaxID=2058898 RepID=UPI000CE5026C|nr:hypothetical protein [Arthrobacter sp. ZGTC131]
MLLRRAGDTLTGNAAHRLADVFAAGDPTGLLEAVWKVNEQLRVLLSGQGLRRRSRSERPPQSPY